MVATGISRDRAGISRDWTGFSRAWRGITRDRVAGQATVSSAKVLSRAARPSGARPRSLALVTTGAPAS